MAVKILDGSGVAVGGLSGIVQDGAANFADGLDGLSYGGDFEAEAGADGRVVLVLGGVNLEYAGADDSGEVIRAPAMRVFGQRKADGAIKFGGAVDVGGANDDEGEDRFIIAHSILARCAFDMSAS